MIKYCNNCGHECHCGQKCKQEYTDGDGERYEVECCKHCRHKEKEKKEEKNEDITALFNGA